MKSKEKNLFNVFPHNFEVFLDVRKPSESFALVSRDS